MEKIEIKVKEVGTSNWNSEVLKSDMPVLVDFYAPWCGPCKLLSSLIDKISKDFEGRIKVLKVNTDINPDVANMYNVSAMPSVFIFNNGKAVSRIIGVNQESKYVNEINKVIGV